MPVADFFKTTILGLGANYFSKLGNYISFIFSSYENLNIFVFNGKEYLFKTFVLFYIYFFIRKYQFHGY